MSSSQNLASAIDFGSIRNHNERDVFTAVQEMASSYPGIGANAELLADVACVALNRLPPRYIRHEVDFAFYRGDREHAEHRRLLLEAVDYAFGFVQARTAMRARG